MNNQQTIQLSDSTVMCVCVQYVHIASAIGLQVDPHSFILLYQSAKSQAKQKGGGGRGEKEGREEPPPPPVVRIEGNLCHYLLLYARGRFKFSPSMFVFANILLLITRHSGKHMVCKAIKYMNITQALSKKKNNPSCKEKRGHNIIVIYT